ncbi:ribose 5-phosphate isomerase A [Ammoniphilus oxalaticus]|uniref:Ribose-5-phosphate isomerase A n=1 Tax=Ammoniphilus oxalaticus TaxID=66863 RepID=A0A419SKB1_9BACL|nr:ribose-5-phosphate isomerase RpiA [Ammoniphilus oxalaticus]RKD24453.1 ribose 5-phosphate isomerase A [Ammoniphilus oxalaticus]
MENQLDQKKRIAAEKAVEWIEDGMLIGLGSGSTVYWFIRKLAERVHDGLRIQGIPSSKRTEQWADEMGIPLTDFSKTDRLDLAIDGADEVDPKLNLIKGGGGSLLREKLVNQVADKLIIIVDDSKAVLQLGQFPLPVEVVPFAWQTTVNRLRELGVEPRLRMDGARPFVSNNQNYIFDCAFQTIRDPQALHRELKQVLGVVETGLFLNMADLVLIGSEQGVQQLKKQA